MTERISVYIFDSFYRARTLDLGEKRESGKEKGWATSQSSGGGDGNSKRSWESKGTAPMKRPWWLIPGGGIGGTIRFPWKDELKKHEISCDKLTVSLECVQYKMVVGKLYTFQLSTLLHLKWFKNSSVLILSRSQTLWIFCDSIRFVDLCHGWLLLLGFLGAFEVA